MTHVIPLSFCLPCLPNACHSPVLRGPGGLDGPNVFY